MGEIGIDIWNMRPNLLIDSPAQDSLRDYSLW